MQDTAEDRTLLEAWRGGDRRAGAALIERHYDAIVRFFAHKAGAHADDLVQRTFLACSESLGSFRGDGHFRAFLFGIARNILLEHIRKHARHRPPLDFNASSLVDVSPGVATVAARRADQRVLVMALMRLPLELQILVELYYWEGMGVEELAEMLAIPEGTVKSRLHRARALLREAMENIPASSEEQRTIRALLEQWALDVRERLDG